MKPFCTAAVLAVSLCVWGCQATPYQRARVAFGRGYADKRLSDDTFHVAFTANYTTSVNTLREYLYRRAAELTLRHGFRYFTVIREPRPLVEYKIGYNSREDAEAGVDAKETEMPAWGTLQMTIQCFRHVFPTADMPLTDVKAYLIRRDTDFSPGEFLSASSLPSSSLAE